MLSVTLPPEQMEWIQRKIADRTYANASHLVEVAVLRMMEADPDWEGKDADRRPASDTLLRSEGHHPG